jgi:hypothetical protein
MTVKYMLVRTSVVHGVADVLEHATLCRGGWHEDEHPLERVVRRQERAGRAMAKVEVVEPKPEPAVHLEVRAEGHPWCGRRGHELLPGGLAEVDERLDVVIINTSHSVADDADHRGVATGEKVSRAHPRECPQHHVAEVLRGTGGRARARQFTATLICVNSWGPRPRTTVIFFHACARRHWNVLHRPPMTTQDLSVPYEFRWSSLNSVFRWSNPLRVGCGGR